MNKTISLGEKNPELKKRTIRKWAFIIILITYLTISLSLIVNPYWGFLFPITIVIIIVAQLISTYFSTEQKDSFTDKIRKEGVPLPDLPSNCYNCGTELKNSEVLKFCEECGVKLS